MDQNLIDHQNAVRILEEGWRLFQQKGYRGLTIDELCLRCGITKPTIYYYFQDKENLFVQVLAHKLHGFHTVIDQPGPLPERLQRVAASILDNFEADTNSLLHDREHLKNLTNLAKVREAFHSEMFAPMIALMQSGIQSGELRGDDPEMLTLIFLGIVNSFIRKTAVPGTDTHELSSTLTQYFLKGAQY